MNFSTNWTSRFAFGQVSATSGEENFNLFSVAAILTGVSLVAMMVVYKWQRLDKLETEDPRGPKCNDGPHKWTSPRCPECGNSLDEKEFMRSPSTAASVRGIE